MTYQHSDVPAHEHFNILPETGLSSVELSLAKMKAALLMTDVHYGIKPTLNDITTFLSEVSSSVDIDILRIPDMDTATAEERLYVVAAALLREVASVGKSNAHEIAIEQCNRALEALANIPDSLADAHGIIDAQAARINELESQLAAAQSRVENQHHVIVTKDMQLEQMRQSQTIETVPIGASAVRIMGSGTIRAANQPAA